MATSDDKVIRRKKKVGDNMDMRISSAYGAYSVQPSRSTHAPLRGTSRTRPDADSISISMEANDFQVARQAVASVPDVREDMVSKIQSQIAAGTYSVSAQAVAAKIFQGATT